MTKQPDLMGMAGPAGLPRGEQGVKRSSENDAKASGFALAREGQSPFSFQRLGDVTATIVARLKSPACIDGSKAVAVFCLWIFALFALSGALSGCGIADRRMVASAEYEEGRVLERRGARGAEAECLPVRRSVVAVGRRGEVRRELTEIPGVC